MLEWGSDDERTQAARALGAAGDGGDDADFVAVLEGGGEVVEEADVFAVDVDVDERLSVPAA